MESEIFLNKNISVILMPNFKKTFLTRKEMAAVQPHSQWGPQGVTLRNECIMIFK